MESYKSMQKLYRMRSKMKRNIHPSSIIGTRTVENNRPKTRRDRQVAMLIDGELKRV